MKEATVGAGTVPRVVVVTRASELETLRALQRLHHIGVVTFRALSR